MTEATRSFSTGIVDFNPKRMSPEKIAGLGIPAEIAQLVADERQYPLRIGFHLPETTQWYREGDLWFYRDVLSDTERVARLLANDALIFSGSGLSAYKFDHQPDSFDPTNRETLETTQEVIREFLFAGKWVLGICFGGQLAMSAVGGRLGRLPDNQYGNAVTEAGLLDHGLTESGRSDPVFGYLAQYETVWAPHLHSDFVFELPQVEHTITTPGGVLRVEHAETLLTRQGYLDRYDLAHPDTTYIHASVVEFDNGARLYQIQPHPEMATPDDFNFLVRKNRSWLEMPEEMGLAYYQQALQFPKGANFAIAQVISRFAQEAQRFRTQQYGAEFSDAVLARDLLRYLEK